MFSKLKKRTEGFTIIEVLIVLAIAGLIMLIVFLAVPALQRNQRNNTRTSEAGRWAAAVTECLSNRNNVTGSCDSDAEIEQGTVNSLTGFALNSNGNTTTVGLRYNQVCSADGASSTAGGTASSFVIMYQLEPAIQRCIGS